MSSGQGTLSELVHQSVIDETVTSLYSPPKAVTVELSRVSLANFSASPQAVTLYHLASGSSVVTPGNDETVAVHRVDPYSTSTEPANNSTTAITLRDGDSLWAKAETLAAAGGGGGGGGGGGVADGVGGFAPVLVGQENYNSLSGVTYDDGTDPGITIPASSAGVYDWLMIRARAQIGPSGSGLSTGAPQFFRIADFEALNVSTAGTNPVSSDNPGHVRIGGRPSDKHHRHELPTQDLHWYDVRATSTLRD